MASDAHHERAYSAVPLIFESDPNNDRFIHVENDFASLRLLSSRCQESRTQSLPNQDYARLIADSEQASLSFCVCDGVGSSFMGGFAANYLGTQLVRWLQRLESIQFQGDEVESLHASLSNALAGWADSGQAELSRIRATPLQQSPLIQEVLEELRTSHGSETVFCAGRIETLAGERSQARQPLDRPAHILLCWMGNVQASLWQSETDAVDIGYIADHHTAWSTARGLCGTLGVYLGTLHTLDRMIVHTDGADSISPAIARLDDKQLADSVLGLLQLPASDDVTVLDVQWKI
jgi:hypothetical protein